MTATSSPPTTTAPDLHSVRANGIDIHYTDTGTGPPLVVLNTAMVSTNPIWAALPFAYTGQTNRLAEHFRVITPDLRGSGRTVHDGRPIPYTLLADDIVALIEALHVDAPLLCGFSEGGTLATIIGIRNPGSAGAIVNHGGHDAFNPDPHAPSYTMTRQMLGGSPDATKADPAMAASQFEELHGLFTLMEADHDAAQGAGHWKTVLAQTFDRVSQPSGYTFEDLRTISAPTLILTGDRDPFCTIEEGATAYRALERGELSVLPNTPHMITPAAVEATIEFFERTRLAPSARRS
jgi:pimeloyl-ACP methyl ester carboxylesterase